MFSRVLQSNSDLYWSYWWLYEPSESTGSEPVIYRTRSFSFFTVYHHVDILGLNELLFSFPPVLELQQRLSAFLLVINSGPVNVTSRVDNSMIAVLNLAAAR